MLGGELDVMSCDYTRGERLELDEADKMHIEGVYKIPASVVAEIQILRVDMPRRQ